MAEMRYRNGEPGCAIDIGAIEMRLGRRRRREQHRLLDQPGGLHRLRGSAAELKRRVSPIRVIVINAPAGGGHNKFKRLDAVQLHPAEAGLLAELARAAAPQLAPVADDDKLNRRGRCPRCRPPRPGR